MTTIMNVTCKETGETICIKANRFNPELHALEKVTKKPKKVAEVEAPPVEETNE